MSIFPSSIDVGLGHVAYFGQWDVGIINNLPGLSDKCMVQIAIVPLF